MRVSEKEVQSTEDGTAARRADEDDETREARQKQDKDTTAATRADESDETREARQKQAKDAAAARLADEGDETREPRQKYMRLYYAMAKDALELEEMDSYSHNPHEKEGPVPFCLCAYCYLKNE